jgi:hypothetical protein
MKKQHFEPYLDNTVKGIISEDYDSVVSVPRRGVAQWVLLHT